VAGSGGRPAKEHGRSALIETVLEVDHLVYAVADLERGVEALEESFGVRAAVGGRHPGEGTRNALLSLGPDRYLEILAPDPGQPRPGRPLWLGLEALERPRLAGWAARARNVEEAARRGRASGVPLGPVATGSRRRADGVLLTWTFTDPHVVVAEGLVPFLIDWGASPHPSGTAPGGVRLLALRGEHPDPAPVTKLLAALGVNLPVTKGSRAALVASLESPRGRLELR
jgi:hypothetical protein